MASTRPKSAAVKAEATGDNIVFVYDGETYIVPPMSEWDLGAIEAFDEGHLSTCVRLVLGDEQWAKFRAKPRKLRDLQELFGALEEATGAPN